MNALIWPSRTNRRKGYAIIAGGWNGNDYHPPGNVGCGEQFLYDIYNTLKGNPTLWKKTLFIVNFDEHGGTYDHITPPTTNVKAPWADSTDGTPEIPVNDREAGYGFTSLGVRVPLILASPLIAQNTVLRSKTGQHFDHTSVLATVLNHFGIPKANWGLGSRTANAGTFEDVITVDPKKARTDVDIFQPSMLQCQANEPTPPNDLQEMIMRRSLRRAAEHHNVPAERLEEMYHEHFSGVKTIVDMNEAAKRVRSQLSKERKTKEEVPEKKGFWAWLISFLKKLFKA